MTDSLRTNDVKQYSFRRRILRFQRWKGKKSVKVRTFSKTYDGRKMCLRQRSLWRSEYFPTQPCYSNALQIIETFIVFTASRRLANLLCSVLFCSVLFCSVLFCSVLLVYFWKRFQKELVRIAWGSNERSVHSSDIMPTQGLRLVVDICSSEHSRTTALRLRRGAGLYRWGGVTRRILRIHQYALLGRVHVSASRCVWQFR